MSKHFRPSEFACKCCGDEKPNSHLIAVLELIREHFKTPIFINSGYRCADHNFAEGGADNSKHLSGMAADIEVTDVTPLEVYTFLNSIFPTSLGLGLYSSFVHVDVRETKARW